MIRIKLLCICCLIVTASALFAQQTDSAYVRDNYTKIERNIPMRDGKMLFSWIFTMPKTKTSRKQRTAFITIQNTLQQ